MELTQVSINESDGQRKCGSYTQWKAIQLKKSEILSIVTEEGKSNSNLDLELSASKTISCPVCDILL
jgi:hypothetical protein